MVSYDCWPFPREQWCQGTPWAKEFIFPTTLDTCLADGSTNLTRSLGSCLIFWDLKSHCNSIYCLSQESHRLRCLQILPTLASQLTPTLWCVEFYTILYSEDCTNYSQATLPDSLLSMHVTCDDFLTSPDLLNRQKCSTYLPMFWCLL